jgi:molybdate transport system substrate-binding protein
MPPVRSSLVAAALAALLLSAAPAAGEDELTLFAAASMSDAMTDAAKAFTAAGGPPVKLAFGSSSTLAKQIENGAPANLYISADLQWMDYLAERGLIVEDSRFNLAGNALVLIAAKESNLAIDLAAGADIAGALEGGKLAIGDPEHVPAGRYAKAALDYLGLWQAVEDSTVFVGDVRAALAFVERAEVAAGIVYATDARISDGVRVVASFPADSHAPIVYPVALIDGHAQGFAQGFAQGLAPGFAQAFLDFLGSDAGAEILRGHGFVVPAPSS